MAREHRAPKAPQSFPFDVWHGYHFDAVLLGQFLQKKALERGVRYQSMGFALLGEIIRVISGRSCSEFLRTEMFQQLWMNDTSLGAPDAWYDESNGRAARIAEIPAASMSNSASSPGEKIRLAICWAAVSASR